MVSSVELKGINRIVTAIGRWFTCQ